MQTISIHRQNFNMNSTAPSGNATMYGTSTDWASSSQDHSYISTPDYARYPRQHDNPFAPQPNFKGSSSTHHDYQGRPNPDPLLSDLDTQYSINAHQGLVPGGGYAGPTYYTPSNGQINGYDHAAISPLNTNYAIDRRSSEPGPSYQSPPYQNPSALAPEFATFVNGNDSSLFEQRHDSLQASYELHPQENGQAKVGRRRGSEYAEPGSARAIYLEKNRKAASKCRSKQKRQQDDLVEAARDVERRNKILKAEVEILKSGMRDLMELVGQHTACPDARLQMYVQREADRLVTASQRGSLPTPSSGRSYSEFSYTDKPSSPDEG
jgi:hypothetical protein